MRLSRKIFLILGFLLSIILAVNLSFDLDSKADRERTDPKNDFIKTNLTVSAAVSLQNSLLSIRSTYQQTKNNIEITYNFGSSGSLQQQIERGAPADLFISASIESMDRLQEKQAILNSTRRNLFTNQLVLIVPKNSDRINNFQDLKLDNIKNIALGEPQSVPVGKYAREVLTYLKTLDAVRSKAVYAKDSRQVLNYVATQNVDAGIVYLTDARSDDRVKIVAIADRKSHSPIIYPAAVIKDTQYPEAATEFLEFLASDRAKTIFKAYGFTPIDPN